MQNENLNSENSHLTKEEFEYDIWGQRSDDPNYMLQPQDVFEEEYAAIHFKAHVSFINQEVKK